MHCADDLDLIEAPYMKLVQPEDVVAVVGHYGLREGLDRDLVRDAQEEDGGQLLAEGYAAAHDQDDREESDAGVDILDRVGELLLVHEVHQHCGHHEQDTTYK